MTITFTKLPEPIHITNPIDVTFTEYHVYDDVVLHVAESTISSVYASGLTPDNFVLREILQNAIDNEILKTGDFLGAYKRVKIRTVETNVGKWNLVESEGTLDEDIFLIGFSTKKEIKETFCRLIGRFGVGLKESIFTLLYQGLHILMMFGGHVYGFGYLYEGKLYYDLDPIIIMDDSTKIKPVILRGEYNVKDKVLVYIPIITESVIPLLYPYKKPYALSPGERGLVYHNGLYSGKWGVPLDINVCNIETDQYRSTVYLSGTLINALEMIADDEMSEAFKKILLKRVATREKIMVLNISYDLKYLFYYAKEKLRNVLQKALDYAVEKLVETMNEKVIIVDRYDRILSKELPAIGLPDIDEKYISNVRSYLADKGYKVFAYSKNLSSELFELYDQIAEPNVPVEVKAMIRLAEWLYSIGVEVMKQYGIPGWSERLYKADALDVELLDPLPGIFDIDVKVVKPQYNDLLTDSLGVTLTLNNKNVVILRNLPKDKWLLYVGIMLHELNHVYSDFEHGTFEWESIYDVLYMIDALSPGTAPYVTNLIRLAVYNPELFLKINNINGLPPYVLPQVLVATGECIGYMDQRGIECDADAPTKLKLVNKNGVLYLEVEPK
jgi:hypothetical protein